MRQKKYIYDLIVQIFLVFVVIQLFRMTPDKIKASYWAGALFCLMPASMMMREWIFFRLTNKLWWIFALQFWLLFAVPIFILRILHPHTSIRELELFGIKMQFWHSVSNFSYLLLMAVTVFCIWKNRKLKKVWSPACRLSKAHEGNLNSISQTLDFEGGWSHRLLSVKIIIVLHSWGKET